MKATIGCTSAATSSYFPPRPMLQVRLLHGYSSVNDIKATVSPIARELAWFTGPCQTLSWLSMGSPASGWIKRSPTVVFRRRAWPIALIAGRFSCGPRPRPGLGTTQSPMERSRDQHEQPK